MKRALLKLNVNHKAPLGLVRLNLWNRSLFSELNGKRGEHIFTLETITPLCTDQMVEIGLEENPCFSPLLMYIVPLFTLLVANIALAISVKMNSSVRFLIFMLSALSFVMVKRYTRKLGQQTEFPACFVKVLSKKERLKTIKFSTALLYLLNNTTRKSLH